MRNLWYELNEFELNENELVGNTNFYTNGFDHTRLIGKGKQRKLGNDLLSHWNHSHCRPGAGGLHFWSIFFLSFGKSVSMKYF